MEFNKASSTSQYLHKWEQEQLNTAMSDCIEDNGVTLVNKKKRKGDDTLSEAARKELHNQVEKRRRDRLTTITNELRSLVPHSKQLPANKATILHQAADYIRRLSQTNKELMESNQRLQELNDLQAAEIVDIRRILWVHYPNIAVNVLGTNSSSAQSTASTGLGNLATLATLGSSSTNNGLSNLVAVTTNVSSIGNSGVLPPPNLMNTSLNTINTMSMAMPPHTLPLTPNPTVIAIPNNTVNISTLNAIPPHTMRSMSPNPNTITIPISNTIGSTSSINMPTCYGTMPNMLMNIPATAAHILPTNPGTMYNTTYALPINTYNSLLKDSCLTNGISSVLSDIAKESVTSFTADVLQSFTNDMLPSTPTNALC